MIRFEPPMDAEERREFKGLIGGAILFILFVTFAAYCYGVWIGVE